MKKGLRNSTAAPRHRTGRRGQIRPWQCLYFFPDPHGHRSLRPTFSPARVNGGGGASATSPSDEPEASASSIAGVLVLHVGDRCRLLDRLHVLLVAHGDGEHDLHHVLLDPVEHVGEEFEGLALVLLLGVLLRIAAQVDALAQVVQRRKVVAPVVVERLQHQAALELAHQFRTDAGFALPPGGLAQVDDSVTKHLVGELGIVLHPLRDRCVDLVLAGEHGGQRRDVPLLLDRFGGDMNLGGVLHLAAHHVADRVGDVVAFEQFIALLVDDAALVVGHVVVLQQLLADVEVARLHAILRLGDRPVDDRMLDGLAIGHLELLHDRAQALAAEDAQQRILERQEEARASRVALPPRAAAQLVVDAARLVAFGADDVQPARLDHVVVADLPVGAHFRDLAVLFRLRHRLVVAKLEDQRLQRSAQHDIRAAAGHVGGDGDGAGGAGLRDDFRLARMLLRVEHLVRELLLLQEARQQFGVLDRRGADQHRLTALVAVLDVAQDRVDLLLERAEDEVVLVLAHHRLVRRDDHGFQVIDLLELEGLGVGRARHAGQLAVHAEIVLERDRRQRLVLALDVDAFLGLDRLVQSVGPAATGHQAPGELVDDDDLAVLHDVVLVAVEQRVRPQRRVKVMHQRDVVRVVEAGARRDQPGLGQDALGILVPGLGQQHRVRLLVHPEIAGAVFLFLARELGHQLVQPVIHVDVVVGLAGDDQRRARLVDQDGVDFVDDRVVEAALHALRRREHHVVAQVVEAEFVVRAVGDVGVVRDLLVGVVHLRQVDADGQAEELVDAPHPVGIALRQVVVDGDDVHALAGQRIEVGRQGCDQRLAFAGAHFGDLAVVQRHAAHQLDVEVTHRQRALARLAHHGKGFGQHGVQLFAGGDPPFQLGGLALERLVRQRRDRRLEGVDLAAPLVRIA